MKSEAGTSWDAIIVGAGPGGLQAAIHLSRYNFRVLLFDGGPGRTSHAVRIENYLGLPAVGGADLVAAGLRQAQAFGATRRAEQAVNRPVEQPSGGRHVA
jgi:thioredoxin reductase (NADPH)